MYKVTIQYKNGHKCKYGVMLGIICGRRKAKGHVHQSALSKWQAHRVYGEGREGDHYGNGKGTQMHKEIDEMMMMTEREREQESGAVPCFGHCPTLPTPCHSGFSSHA